MSSRKSRLLAAMAAERLDGLLLFVQESDYWLTGYDTFGFCFFQCLYVGADGRVALLTRSADLRQAQHTSDIADIRIWRDGAGGGPPPPPKGPPPRRSTSGRSSKISERGDGSASNSTATALPTSTGGGSRRRSLSATNS